MNTPSSVMHVVLSLDPGGLERVVLDLAREGCRSGRSVSVVCLERPGSLAPKARELGVRVESLNKPAGLKPGLFPRLASLLRSVRPDLIHTHQIGALFYTGPVANAPILHTEHGKTHDDGLRRHVLGRLSTLYTSRFICVSRDIAAEILHRGIASRSKLRIIPNGIDTGRFAGIDSRSEVRSEFGIPDEALVVGTVARLDPIKRLDRLIRAFHQVRVLRPNIRLLIVGDGPERPHLARLVDDLDLAGVAHFAGYSPDPERYLGAMDCFALTSRSEGMPLAVLEAWAAGLPVVSVRVGGLPELIDDGRNGVFAETEDAASIANALARLIDDPLRSRRIGLAGRETVNAVFSLGRMVENYDREYEAVLRECA